MMSADRQVVVIGGGVAGLATACLLATEFQVTLVEKNRELGGRVGRMRDAGFAWDTGPSWLLMMDAFQRFYRLLGTSVEEELELVRLDPAYRVFQEGFDPVDVRSGTAEVSALFDALSPGAGSKVAAYLEAAGESYAMAMEWFLYTSYSSVRPFANRALAAQATTLRTMLFNTLKDLVERDFSHPVLRTILQYPAMFLATDPAETPALYHLLSHLDLVEGVFYPMGGFRAVVDSLVHLAKARGVVFRCGTEAVAITTTPRGRKHRVTGVRVRRAASISEEPEFLAAEAVISAGDLHHTETKLLPERLRDHSARSWRKKNPGISAVVALLGVEGALPQLVHHQLVVSADWSKDFDAVFRSPEGFSRSVYVCKPSATDGSVAPFGHENLFVLIPTAANPVLGHGSAYDPQLGADPKVEAIIDDVIELIATRCGIPDLAQRITQRRSIGPADFADRYFSWRGSALGMAHTLRQSAFFRDGQSSNKVLGLFFAGATTNPGVGLPMCLISAENAAQLVAGYVAESR